MYDYLHSIYYIIDNIPPKDIRLLIDKLKGTITSLIIKDKSPRYIEIPEHQKFKKINEEEIFNEEADEINSYAENNQNF